MPQKATPIPFGTSNASVKASRNLLYLHSKGLIADPRTPRLTAEIHLDNTFRATKKDQLQFRRAGFIAAQAVANDKWLYPQNQPVSRERNRRLTAKK